MGEPKLGMGACICPLIDTNSMDKIYEELNNEKSVGKDSIKQEKINKLLETYFLHNQNQNKGFI